LRRARRWKGRPVSNGGEGRAARLSAALSEADQSRLYEDNIVRQTGGRWTELDDRRPQDFNSLLAMKPPVRPLWDWSSTAVARNARRWIEPALAESWKNSSDGKTWTFTLRKGVKMGGGTAFHAMSSSSSFDLIYDKKSRRARDVLTFDGKPLA